MRPSDPRHLHILPPAPEAPLDDEIELLEPELLPGPDAVPLEEIQRKIRRSRFRVVEDGRP